MRRAITHIAYPSSIVSFFAHSGSTQGGFQKGRIAYVNARDITVSDSCFRGLRADRSGPEVVHRLQKAGFVVDGDLIVPDDLSRIAAALREQAGQARLVVTTGGTGIAARDVTPEATRVVCERILDGFGEQMRREGLNHTPFAPMSRAVSGTLGSSLIVNVPGNPRAAVQSLEAVLHLIPHALALLSGDTEHAEPGHASEKV